jgi:hypothetical protein
MKLLAVNRSKIAKLNYNIFFFQKTFTGILSLKCNCIIRFKFQAHLIYKQGDVWSVGENS